MRCCYVLGAEVLVNAKLAALSEAALGTVVVVAEVVAVAGRHKGEAERVVRGSGAAVRSPVNGVRVPGVAAGREGGQGDAEEQFVGDLDEALAGLDVTGGREGDGARGKGQDGSGELHLVKWRTRRGML